MTMEVSISDGADPELIWVGDDAWVARDPGLPDGDPHRVIAYIEHKDHHVYVLWFRGRQDVCCYETVHEALHDVALACRSRGARYATTT